MTKRPASIIKQISPLLSDLYEALEETIASAGSKKEFQQFTEKLDKVLKKKKKPFWDGSIMIQDSFYFAFALFYLMHVYKFEEDYVNGILADELSNYQKAVENDQSAHFMLRFYKDKDDVFMEASTVIEAGHGS